VTLAAAVVLVALTLVASAAWLYAVLKLHVFAHQTHHYYYGLVLLVVVLPWYASPPCAALAWLGFSVLLDDAVQHSVQLVGLRTHRMTLYLWRSPLHLLGHRLGLY
jgi:hypothetical protein